MRRRMERFYRWDPRLRAERGLAAVLHLIPDLLNSLPAHEWIGTRRQGRFQRRRHTHRETLPVVCLPPTTMPRRTHNQGHRRTLHGDCALAISPARQHRRNRCHADAMSPKVSPNG
jgi:hypothetical protein